MKHVGMATHSNDAFNEMDAVTLLARVLESKHTIKTFFGVNDKTPNHDGFFELVDANGTPRKQFIVQIKKTENILPNAIGPNKGKYVYRMKTNFLYYVKEKVTENPAIYFVVDISNQKIFWLYLSDEVLMNLNFEDHEYISFAFAEEHVLADIDEFTQKINRITATRNELILYKSPEEIAELQDALEEINHSLDFDLKTIKKELFPTLWRFGVKYSRSSDVILTMREKTIEASASYWALYPQIKGVADTGIHEFRQSKDNLFRNITIGEKSPTECGKETLHKIVQSFFTEGAFIKYMPDIVLFELAYAFICESNPIFGIKQEPETITLDAVERRLFLLAQYVQYILQNPPQTQAEHQIKTGLVAHLERGESGFCSIAQYCFTSCGKESFQNFINSQREYKHRFPAIAFQIMSNEYFFYLFALCELRERKIETISRVWKYNWYELRTLSSRDFMQQIDVIFSEWMSNLPELYSQCYKKLFRDDKYRFTGRYLFRNKDTRYSETMSRVTSVVHHYSASQLEICYDQNICEEFSDENRAKGLKSIHKGLIFDAFLDRKLMFCDAIACLLYQGICQGLGYQPVPLHMGAHIHGRGLSLFI